MSNLTAPIKYEKYIATDLENVMLNIQKMRLEGTGDPIGLMTIACDLATLIEAILGLNRERIKHRAHLDGCFAMLNAAIKHNTPARRHAASLSIRNAARSVRLSICQVPRVANDIEAIANHRKKKEALKVGYVHALLPFAFKVMEKQLS